jgi:acetyltransferase
MNDSDVSSVENHSALESLFSPKSVAVIGATDREGTVGRTVLENQRSGTLRRQVYAVNPNRTEVLGLRCSPKIEDVHEKVHLVVLVTPAQTVPVVIGECVDAGVHAAIVISAGFMERGAEGAALELRIQEQLRRGTMRLIGPNCLGVMNPNLGLNATFELALARSGNFTFLSQSGARRAVSGWRRIPQVIEGEVFSHSWFQGTTSAEWIPRTLRDSSASHFQNLDPSQSDER